MGEEVLMSLAGPLISGFIGGSSDASPQVMTADQAQTRLQRLLQDPTALSILQNLGEASNAKTAMKAGQREQYIKNKGLRNGQPVDPTLNIAKKEQGFLDKELAQAGRPSLDEILKGVNTQQTVKSPSAPLRSVPQDTGMRMPVDDGSMNFKNFVDTLPGAKGEFTSLANTPELPKNADGNYVLNAGTRSERIISPAEYAKMTSARSGQPGLDAILGMGEAMVPAKAAEPTPVATTQTGNSGGGMSNSGGALQNTPRPISVVQGAQATTPASGIATDATGTITDLFNKLIGSYTDKGKDSVLNNLLSNVFPGSGTDWTEPSAYWDYGDKIQVSTDPLETKIKGILGGKLDNDPLIDTITKLQSELEGVGKPGSVQKYNPYLDKLEQQALDVRALRGGALEDALFRSAVDPAQQAAKEAAKARASNMASKGMLNSSVLQDYDTEATNKLNELISNAGFGAKVQGMQFDQSNINQAANIYNNLANLFGQTQDDMTGNIMDKLGLATTKSDVGRQNISDVMGFLGNQDEKELTNINLKYNEFLRRLNEIKNAEGQAINTINSQQAPQIASMNAQNDANTNAWKASQANAANTSTLAGNTVASMFGNKKQRTPTGAIPASITNNYQSNPAVSAANAFSFNTATPAGTSWTPLSTRPKY